MSREKTLQVFVPIAILVAAVVTNVIGRQHPKSPQVRPASLTAQQICLADSEISTALRTLSSGLTYEDQQKAVALLKSGAERSPDCRKQVITRLMSAMDQPNLDLTGGTHQFYLWHYGTELLGELKAVEALDLLIANLHLHDGSGWPLNHYPAIGGVIDMGDVALPKLQAVVNGSANPETRRYAVFCIAQIGGQSAEQILKGALPNQADQCTASCIRATLKSFANKRRPHHISDEGRTEWYSTFLCNG